MSYNLKFKKLKFRNSNKRNNNVGRKKFNQNKANKRFKVYHYVIRTAIVNYITPDYTEQNLNFQVGRLLLSNNTYSLLAKQYQQYRLDKVTFVAIPRQVGGTDPSPIWIYLDTEGLTDGFNYNAIQEIQGSRQLPVKYKSFTHFSQSGRQDDFHYWYDTDQRADFSIRLHSEAPPNNSKFWQFQIEYSVSFRGFIVPEEEEGESKAIKVQQIGELKRLGEGTKEEKVDKVEVPLDPNIIVES